MTVLPSSLRLCTSWATHDHRSITGPNQRDRMVPAISSNVSLLSKPQSKQSSGNTSSRSLIFCRVALCQTHNYKATDDGMFSIVGPCCSHNIGSLQTSKANKISKQSKNEPKYPSQNDALSSQKAQPNIFHVHYRPGRVLGHVLLGAPVDESGRSSCRRWWTNYWD